MNSAQVQRITGWSGVIIGLGSISLIPLYFTYSGVPPSLNVLTRNLINLVLCAFLIIFMAGFSYLIRKRDPACEWIASLVYGASLTYVAVLLVGISLEVGAIFGGPEGTIDPTVDGPLAHGAVLIHGSIGRALTVVITSAAGYAGVRTRLLPACLGWAAYGIALINLIFVPSMYFGTDPAQFYSALGWGNTAFVASFIAYWIMAVGVRLLRNPQNVAGQIRANE